MNEYHYDQIYSYEKIMQEVKELIIPTFVDRINKVDTEITGLEKWALADVIYSSIMALGYNDEDINASLNDLMPTRNQLIYRGPENSDAVSMSFHLCVICKELTYQVNAFSNFHKMTQALKPHDEIIDAVTECLSKQTSLSSINSIYKNKATNFITGTFEKN
ncbi:MAG: hypothetical protein ACLQQ4_08380 [Bacteroidia bacterium]